MISFFLVFFFFFNIIILVSFALLFLILFYSFLFLLSTVQGPPRREAVRAPGIEKCPAAVGDRVGRDRIFVGIMVQGVVDSLHPLLEIASADRWAVGRNRQIGKYGSQGPGRSMMEDGERKRNGE